MPHNEEVSNAGVRHALSMDAKGVARCSRVLHRRSLRVRHALPIRGQGVPPTLGRATRPHLTLSFVLFGDPVLFAWCWFAAALLILSLGVHVSTFLGID